MVTSISVRYALVNCLMRHHESLGSLGDSSIVGFEVRERKSEDYGTSLVCELGCASTTKYKKSATHLVIFLGRDSNQAIGLCKSCATEWIKIWFTALGKEEDAE